VKLKQNKLTVARWRYALVMAVLLVLPVALIWHIAGLQVLPDVDKGYEFLQGKVSERMVRREVIPAYRGVITDRYGEPLAISSPVIQLVAEPRLVDVNHPKFSELAKHLSVSSASLKKRVLRYTKRPYLVLKAGNFLPPAVAEKILAWKIPGIYGQKTYKRFYPAAEVTSQIVGITDDEEKGREGIERSYENILAGVPGQKKFLQDRMGSVIKDLGTERNAQPGEAITLSIDMRLQHKAYTELQDAVAKHQATSGSIVVIDVHTGEILAMANQPSYNPNDTKKLNGDQFAQGARNRAILDLFEPGSTVKPFTVLAAMESNKISAESIIDTNPGYIQIDKKRIKDEHNYGEIGLADLLKKSSNVGAIKLGLAVDPEDMHDLFSRVGFGQVIGTGIAGESPGTLPVHKKSMKIERANFAIGYSLSASALQIAQAYAVLASDGLKKPLTLLKTDKAPEGEQVVNAELVAVVRKMMIGVTRKGGTAEKAAIYAYDVAGKTGTAYKNIAGEYDDKRYVALFAGIAPANKPRLVTVVIIDDPKVGGHTGGQVAGPVYANVTERALRVLRIAPKVELSDRAIALRAESSPIRFGGDI
jgi:cell division protein FtsI (penicillin-binding protein 3)|tara:strand:+ start:2117 stop:3886 length:1770 start_codon:yes stop_codon:yes gene_type:complete